MRIEVCSVGVHHEADVLAATGVRIGHLQHVHRQKLTASIFEQAYLMDKVQQIVRCYLPHQLPYFDTARPLEVQLEDVSLYSRHIDFACAGV